MVSKLLRLGMSGLMRSLRFIRLWLIISLLIKESYFYRPRLDGVHFHSLSNEDNTSLIVPFLLTKIDRAVACYDCNKKMSLNGFISHSLRGFLPLFRDDFGVMFQQFHQLATLPRSLPFSLLL